MFSYMDVYMYLQCVLGAQRPERMFYPLELEFETVVSCHVGTE